MQVDKNFVGYPDFRFNLEEISGAVGDFGTLIPIIIGVAVVSDINLGYILLFFSIWYVITGLYFKMPVPVEPMKVIGAVVIAGGLSADQIKASGIIIGILFLLLGYLNQMKWIKRIVPNSAVRGIQLGLALILIRTSIRFISQDYIIAGICICILFIFVMAKRFYNIPDISALFILIFGAIAGAVMFGIPDFDFISKPVISIPSFNDFINGGWLLVIPQVPLTITNSILATSLLMKDLVNRDIDPDKLAKSIGIMNLISAPIGGFPMCHGAGGLAAQYRFGARTGMSNIISGMVLLPIALFCASPGFLALIPYGVIGALLVFVAVELGKHSLKTDSAIITLLTGILSLIFNITIAFITGIFLAGLLKYYKAKKRKL